MLFFIVRNCSKNKHIEVTISPQKAE